ncbi:MAG: hypothetical protein ACR2I2_22080 [Bryobacteraceae bacterium]
MIGMLAIHRGPPNEVCAKSGVPKITDLTVAYSRDGIKWERPDRGSFLACSQKPGTWNRGYLHSSGGVCLVVGDELWFRGKHLFVNANVKGGELRAEVLDESGKVVQPFSRDDCVPAKSDRTAQAVTWSGGEDLSRVAGRPSALRFFVTKGEIYSFWVIPDTSGASYGYVAAGGPGFTGPTDTAGFTGARI